jgi:hypothetical protein
MATINKNIRMYFNAEMYSASNTIVLLTFTIQLLQYQLILKKHRFK